MVEKLATFSISCKDDDLKKCNITAEQAMSVWEFIEKTKNEALIHTLSRI